MASKRPPGPQLIANPFIKKRNLGWTLESPAIKDTESKFPVKPVLPGPAAAAATTNATAAAVESGAASTDDHLEFFTNSLQTHIRPPAPGERFPCLPISDYEALYRTHAGNPDGSYFVIHQHDHPIAGTHYDLRLQINASSSVSWAIMYGLPGDPNSGRLNRNATETRIHCLWNHLIETASTETGSILIWDTGTYSILPRRSKHAPSEDPDSPSSSPPDSSPASRSQQALLHAAFQNRKIRLRLHGARLPDPYILNLRLTKTEDASGRARSKSSVTGGRKRRRRRVGMAKAEAPPQQTSDEEEYESNVENDDDDRHVVPQQTMDTTSKELSAMDKEIRELEDEQVRTTNAYPGAYNTIGSVHQRKWYLSLDRPACGFKQARNRRWGLQPGEESQLEQPAVQGRPPAWPFYVRGADHERSVVTGRCGSNILQDEGVTCFVPRLGWKPVLN